MKRKPDSVDNLIAGKPVLTYIHIGLDGDAGFNEFAMLTDDQMFHVAKMLQTAKERKNIEGYNVIFAIDGVNMDGSKYTAGIQRYVAGFERRRVQRKQEGYKKAAATKAAKAGA